MPTSVDLPGDALVVRFSPTSPEKVLEKAELVSRVSGTHLSSVFAAAAQLGETEDQLLARILRATETDFDPVRNRNVFICTRASALRERGFTFVKDDYPGEIPEHYSVDLGSAPTVEDAKRFLGAFERRRRQAAS